MPIQKTILLLNNFVANTTSFFNAFSETVEKKISSVSNKITELETLLAVLEAKLNSIPDLNGSAATEQVPGVTSVTQPVHAPANTVHESHEEQTIAAPSEPVVTAAVATVDSSKVPVSEHPDYLPFFRLLKVGVPPFVVQAKVTAAGLDASMIDTPNRLVDA